MFKCGLAKTDITPPLGIMMGGHPGLKLATGVLDPLFVRALTLSDGEHVLALVSLDLLFVGNDSVNRIRAAVAKRLELPGECVALAATHTHSGPLTTGLFGYTNDSQYSCAVEAAVVDCIERAWRAQVPSEILVSSSLLPHCAANARFIMQDGRIETHPWKGDPDILYPEGPVDDQVLALHVVNSRGELLGLLVNWANHPQILAREDTRLSADFPGYMEREVARMVGHDVVALFMNGACGNVCPVDARQPGRCEVGEVWANWIGEQLAAAALDVNARRCALGRPSLRCATTTVKLTIRDLPEGFGDELQSGVDADRPELRVSNYGIEGPGQNVLSLGEYLQTSAWKSQAAQDLHALASLKARTPIVPVDLVAQRLGKDTAMLFLPFELFVEFGLELKQCSPFRHTLVVTMANGIEGYLPTRQAFQRPGGYETLTLTSSKFVPAAGEAVVSAALELLNQLHAMP